MDVYFLQDGDVKLKDCQSERVKCRQETDRLKKKLYGIEQENNELKRRLVRDFYALLCLFFFLQKWPFSASLSFTFGLFKRECTFYTLNNVKTDPYSMLH